MSATEPNAVLTRMLAAPVLEGECVEFKEADDSFSTSDIGKYFSALANEANLRGADHAWLVFGVRNRDRQVVGTAYRPETARLQSLKHQVTQGTGGPTFREIYETQTAGLRVLLFEIPPAPRGHPVAWHGHRWARAGESLVALSQDKEDEIRRQSTDEDWSAGVCAKATIADLDPAALAKARASFTLKQSERLAPAEIARWSDQVFLNHAKLTVDGAITRTAIILLGLAESTHHLSPATAEMTWKLEGAQRGGQHFGPPFLLNTSALFTKIRNLKVPLLPHGVLVPIEIQCYDPKLVLEALHNCIAHQDYTRHARIVVTEQPQRLVFENAGTFFEGKPEDYILHSKVPQRYRNRFLAEAMANLRMIDRMGFGISDMFRGQARRYFPLPDYDPDCTDSVRLTFHGTFIDENYSRMVLEKSDLTIAEIVALDRVQKNLPLDPLALKDLRRKNLVEGRKPAIHVAATVAAATNTRAQYIRQKGFDHAFYRQRILEYIGKFGAATREDITKLLWQDLSSVLSEKQKQARIHNLITRLRQNGDISPDGRTRGAKWLLVAAGAATGDLTKENRSETDPPTA